MSDVCDDGMTHCDITLKYIYLSIFSLLLLLTNCSAIAGFEETVLRPKCVDEASIFEEYTAEQHLALTAETHNFPTAISPFR